MANKTIAMQKMRQVLRLRSQGKGIKSIHKLLDLSSNTVKKYIARLEDCGQDLDAIYPWVTLIFNLFFKSPLPSPKAASVRPSKSLYLCIVNV